MLLIADISGYTRFMMNNHTARVHAHGIISDLLSAVIQEVRVSPEANKLQGDAIFMVAERQKDDWRATGSDVGVRLDRFTSAFDGKRTELVTPTHRRPVTSAP
ncbi:MAG: hypothetical protein K8S94_05145 [Planctomycetia bacterium]|nr:hypothetical protein [Planctomycetia bacterium]